MQCASQAAALPALLQAKLSFFIFILNIKLKLGWLFRGNK
jgi:hypothetical protein